MKEHLLDTEGLYVAAPRPEHRKSLEQTTSGVGLSERAESWGQALGRIAGCTRRPAERSANSTTSVSC
jgi:hypothetical protein